MIPAMIGDLFLILSLAILFLALYYLIERVSGELIADDCRQKKCDLEDFVFSEKKPAADAALAAADSHEVKHAAKESRGRKGTGVHFVFSKQSQSHKKRSAIRAGKQPLTHGFVR